MIPGNSLVSIYRNVYDKTSQYTISVDAALERIKSGNSERKIIELRNEADKDRQQKLKSNLPSVTFSGTFSERDDAKMIKHSGFVCMDFDDVDVVSTIAQFQNWPHTYAAWVSPRGTGVKVLLRIANAKKHREHYLALKKEFTNLDPHCINESRVCYESFDPEIFINTNAKAYQTCIRQEVMEDRKVATDTFEIYKKLITWTENSKKSDKTFHEGNRNYFAFILAGAMCRHGIAIEDSLGLIVQDYSAGDFTKKEIEKTVNSAYRINQKSFGTAEFSDSKFSHRETRYEIDPQILDEGYSPDGIIYGNDVYQAAVEIYMHGHKSAETTHIPALDNFFKFKRGELTLLSGIGNYGKSQYLNQLMLIRSLKTGNKWGVFSPENIPAEEYYLDLTESLIGCRCDNSQGYIPRGVFDAAYEFVSNHFFFVYPENISPSPAYIKTKFLELILKEKIDGAVIDPFNQLENDYGRSGRSDKYLETFLSDCIRFAQTNNVFFFIVAHPHKLKKDGASNYPCPDVYEIADGAMWNNKCDNILMYHRPHGQSDPENPSCEHHSKKIRRQKMVGKKGMFEFEFNRKKRRFYFDGFSPLDGNKFEFVQDMKPKYEPKNFSEAEKDDTTVPF